MADVAVYLSALVNCKSVAESRRGGGAGVARGNEDSSAVRQRGCTRLTGSGFVGRLTYEVVRDLFEPSGISDNKVDVETVERFAAVDPQLDLLLLGTRTERPDHLADGRHNVERSDVDTEQAHVELGDVQDVCNEVEARQ